MFILERFFVAMEDGEVAAITACTDGEAAPIHLEKAELKRHLGFVRGAFAYSMLKKNLQEHGYPFELSKDTGSIEFVATTPEYRNKGVAYALIEHVMGNRPYKNFVLEVADTNEAALRLYRRLGFEEFKRVKAPGAKASGVNFFVYMKKGFAV
jgi:ribosomal protein S18 acetylase RimI-like enzyme